MPTANEMNPLAGTRVLIVEDEALIAEELRQRLSRYGMRVIGAVHSAHDAIDRALRDRPEVILMDVRLKGALDGIAAAQRIREHIHVALVYLTAHSDRPTIDRAKETCPDAYLLKPFHERDLMVSLEMALHRFEEVRADTATVEERRELEEIRGRFDALTPRQRDVFVGVVSGSLNRQIAAELGTTERTIKAHRAAVMTKMQVASVVDLVRLAERLGI